MMTQGWVLRPDFLGKKKTNEAIGNIKATWQFSYPCFIESNNTLLHLLFSAWQKNLASLSIDTKQVDILGGDSEWDRIFVLGLCHLSMSKLTQKATILLPSKWFE